MKFWPNLDRAQFDDYPQVPEKAIFWATETGHGNMYNGDSSHFPDRLAMDARRNADWPTPLATFKEAVSQAVKRVWILDHYFLDPEQDKGTRTERIDQILRMITENMIATDIRIITKNHNKNRDDKTENLILNQFSEHIEIINSYKGKDDPPCKIELRFTLSKLQYRVHDRFAIIDNELWHFGATVGGFYSQVSAATRGWKASDHRADDFFEIAWNAPKIQGKEKNDY